MKKVFCLGIVFLLLCLSIRAWPEERFTLGGYYKNFSILLMLPAYKLPDMTVNEPDRGAVSNRLRIKFGLHPSSKFSFHFAYDFSPRIQDPSLFEENVLFSGLKPLEYRFDDFRSQIYPGPGEPVSSFGLFHNLDRFYFTIKTKIADIFVGRQAIAWGSARVVNPTDVLAPFAFNELDTEDRRGVDAIRVRIPLGVMDELDIGFVAGKDFHTDKSAFFLRGKIYAFQTDLSVLLLGFRKHLLLGLDLARSIGRAGFWLETAYVIPECFKKTEVKDKNYFRASVGLDYNLTPKTYGFVEYHFNSAGSNQPEQYMRLLESSAYKDGSVYLMGKHYLNIGSTYQLFPLVPVTGILIFNLSDGSVILTPQLEYNIAENIYISAGAYIGIGKKSELVLGPLVSPPLLMRSEFGAYPDMLFTSFRIYF